LPSSGADTGLHFAPFAPDVLSARLPVITRADEQAESVKILRRQIACANAGKEGVEAVLPAAGRRWAPRNPTPVNVETTPLLN
jgi:hypothetical protein